MSRFVLLASILTGVILTGCSPTLSTFAPARTTPAGHLQITTAVDIVDTSGPIREVLDDGVDNMRNPSTGPLTADEVRRAADAASAALIQPPAYGYQLSLSYGLSRRFELGVRTGMNNVRGHLRWQFLRVAPGFYGALGIGATTYFMGYPLAQVTGDAVSVDRFSRHEIDIPLSFGWSGRLAHLWFGPKLILSGYDAQFSACIAEDATGNCARDATATLGGSATYFAAQGGVALGWRQIWIAAELTVAKVDVDADMTIESGTMSEDRRFTHGGWAIAPTVGLITWF